MSTGLKAHIDGGLAEQRFVLLPHGSEGIDLGMPLAATHMIAFAYDTVAAHYHGPDHRVWSGVALSVLCQLKASLHECLVFRHNFVRKDTKKYHYFPKNFKKTFVLWR